MLVDVSSKKTDLAQTGTFHTEETDTIFDTSAEEEAHCNVAGNGGYFIW